jgi:hypothetical protein
MLATKEEVANVQAIAYGGDASGAGFGTGEGVLS